MTTMMLLFIKIGDFITKLLCFTNLFNLGLSSAKCVFSRCA